MNDIARKEWEILLEGNERFANGICTCDRKHYDTLKKLANHQEPKAIVFGCSDSRVSPEIIFDCGIGDLFVIRTAGASVGMNSDIIESIEFAINKLKCPLFIHLGHDDCNFMNLAKTHSDDDDKKYHSIIENVCHIMKDGYDLNTNEISKKHSYYLIDVLLERSEVIKNAVEKGELSIINAHLDFDSGKISLI